MLAHEDGLSRVVGFVAVRAGWDGLGSLEGESSRASGLGYSVETFESEFEMMVEGSRSEVVVVR